MRTEPKYAQNRNRNTGYTQFCTLTPRYNIVPFDWCIANCGPGLPEAPPQEGVGRGQITEFPGRKDCVIDCVPVDYVCNVIIAAAQQVGIEASQEPVQIYQCASGALGQCCFIWGNLGIS